MRVPTILWRDHLPAPRDVPEIFAGSFDFGDDITGDARNLFELGIRRVELTEPVDLTCPGADADADVGLSAVRAVAAVRDLTAWGIVVSWRLTVPADWTSWQSLGHLSPPAQIAGLPGGAAVTAALRHDFYLAKCIYREGPGFVEVRDRRSGDLSRIIIDDPGYRSAVHDLETGILRADVPDDVLAAFEDEDLVLRVGEYALWLPYRVRRWPHPPLSV